MELLAKPYIKWAIENPEEERSLKSVVDDFNNFNIRPERVGCYIKLPLLQVIKLALSKCLAYFANFEVEFRENFYNNVMALENKNNQEGQDLETALYFMANFSEIVKPVSSM